MIFFIELGVYTFSVLHVIRIAVDHARTSSSCKTMSRFALVLVWIFLLRTFIYFTRFKMTLIMCETMFSFQPLTINIHPIPVPNVSNEETSQRSTPELIEGWSLTKHQNCTAIQSISYKVASITYTLHGVESYAVLCQRVSRRTSANVKGRVCLIGTKSVHGNTVAHLELAPNTPRFLCGLAGKASFIFASPYY